MPANARTWMCGQVRSGAGIAKRQRRERLGLTENTRPDEEDSRHQDRRTKWGPSRYRVIVISRQLWCSAGQADLRNVRFVAATLRWRGPCSILVTDTFSTEASWVILPLR